MESPHNDCSITHVFMLNTLRSHISSSFPLYLLGFASYFRSSSLIPLGIPIDFFFLFFLQHMEVPRRGMESEPQLPAYDSATATWDPSHICSQHQGLRQCWILNPLSEAGDQTHILIDTSQVLNPLSYNGNSPVDF